MLPVGTPRGAAVRRRHRVNVADESEIRTGNLEHGGPAVTWAREERELVAA